LPVEAIAHAAGQLTKWTSQVIEWTYNKNKMLTRVPTGQGKLESGNLNCQGKVRGEYFCGKVRENEKLVQPDVRFSG